MSVDRSEVESKVISIIVEQLGIEESEVNMNPTLLMISVLIHWTLSNW